MEINQYFNDEELKVIFKALPEPESVWIGLANGELYERLVKVYHKENEAPREVPYSLIFRVSGLTEPEELTHFYNESVRSGLDDSISMEFIDGSTVILKRNSIHLLAEKEPGYINKLRDILIQSKTQSKYEAEFFQK